MRLQRVLVLLVLEWSAFLGVTLPTVGIGSDLSIRADRSNLSPSPLPEEQLRRSLLLDRIIQYNETEKCRQSEDPFEFPAMIPRDPMIDEVGFPPWDYKDRIAIELFKTNRRDRPLANAPVYAGACLDQRFYRPTLVLTPSQMAVYGLKPHSDFIAIANVKGFNGFYVAWIDLNAIDEFIVQNVRRPVPLIGDKAGHFGTHVQLRVTFAHPIRLIPQWPLDGRTSLETDELVLSIQGSSKIGAARDFFGDAMDGSYLTLNTTFTPDFKVFEDYFHNSNWGKMRIEIEQFALDLTRSDKRKVLVQYWQESNRLLASRHFFILSNNCKVELVQLFDRSLKLMRLRRANVLRENWLTRISPDGAKLGFANRGLIADWKQASRPNLETEIETQKTLAWLRSLNDSELKSIVSEKSSTQVCN
jgi:hypothetical protein